ncbi:alpha/beta hydrolase [Leptolyngbya iicbica LK]|uniref:Alpha/beta hydrolase n=2 Tax=Cyanophyceae TaxID=3028117 RepID=A0A4V2E2D9_9CYAN|nr:alpha/beta hydrolase [Leptolyngbya sp. LK]
MDWNIQLLDWLMQRRKPTHQLSLPAIQQRNAAKLNGLLAWYFLGEKLSLSRVVDRTCTGRHGSIPVRLYYPSPEPNLPLIVFFHGGGWVTGSLETHDRVCRRIAQATMALVVSVDYRLAPWHKFPLPLEDCYDAVQWAATNAAELGADADRLIVMGDSAGGNLAAAVALMARDQSGPKIHRQVLIYPAVDGTLSSPSHQRYTDAPLLSRTGIHYFRDQYQRSPQDIHNAYFSPLLADDLSHLPPAFILTAEYDPLRDEGEQFAQRLTAAGVPVRYQDYPGMVHAFLNFPRHCSAATAAIAAIGEYVKAA